MTNSARAPVRERILATATALFYSRGINATGIDLIIREAAIAKASLYHHFASKELLVAAYLAALCDQFEAALDHEVMKRGNDIAIPFDFLEENLANGEFFGCPFTNALTEMPASELVIDQVERYRSRVLEFFTLGVGGDRALAQDLMLIYDGVFTSCRLDPKRVRVKGARDLARRLLDHSKI